MTDSPKYEQPLDLVGAPPMYPSHSYEGEGIIVVVRIGAKVVGHLTRQGDAVGWDAAPPPESDEAIVSDIVFEILRRGAREGRPLDEAWLEVLEAVQHDSYRYAPLDGLRGT